MDYLEDVNVLIGVLVCARLWALHISSSLILTTALQMSVITASYRRGLGGPARVIHHVYELGLLDARPSEGQQRPLQEFLRLHRAHVGTVGGGAQRQSLALPDSVRVNRALRI